MLFILDLRTLYLLYSESISLNQDICSSSLTNQKKSLSCLFNKKEFCSFLNGLVIMESWNRYQEGKFFMHFFCFSFGYYHRVPCRAGMCTTPLHFTSSQLITSEIFPVPVVKALLYPGAVANGLVMNMTVPSWNNLLDIYNLTNVKEVTPVTDLQRLEVHFLFFN